MVNTRHYGILGISAVSVAQGIGAACGDTNITSALSAGNFTLIALTIVDFVIARLKRSQKA